METLLDLAWKNAVLVTALAVLVAGTAFVCRRRPALVHTLWLLVLIKFLILPFYPVEVPNLPEFSLPEIVGTIFGQKSPALCDANSLSTGFAKNSDVHNEAEVSLPAGQGISAQPEARIPSRSPGVAGAESRPRSSALSRGFEDSAPATQVAAGGMRAGLQPPFSPPEAAAPEEAAGLVPAAQVAPAALEAASSGASNSPLPWPPAFSWKSAAVTIWLTGSLAWLAVAGIRVFRFQRLLGYARPASGSVAEQARVLADRLGLRRCPEIFFIPAPVSPMLWALAFRAKLLIPAALWHRLSEEQRQTLLIHELAHLRRGDDWVRRLELLVTALFWWHPVLWWAQRQLRRAEEECCDAWVVWALPAARPTYAATLVETLAFLSNTPPALPLGASGIEHIHHLKRRLAMIMNGTSSRAMSRAGFWVVLGLGLVLLPLVPTSAQPQAVGGDEENQALDPPPPEKPGRAPSPHQPSGMAPLPLDRQEQLEAARDEVELLQAQVNVKKAEIGEAETQVKSSQRSWARLNELHNKGAVSIEEFSQARDQLELRKAQLETKRAQLLEVEVHLKQATRRVERLTQQQPERREGRKRGGAEAAPGVMAPRGAGLQGAAGAPPEGGPPGHRGLGVPGRSDSGEGEAGGAGIGGGPPGRPGLGAPGGPQGPGAGAAGGGRRAMGPGGVGRPGGPGAGAAPGSSLEAPGGPGGASMAEAGGGGMAKMMQGMQSMRGAMGGKGGPGMMSGMRGGGPGGPMGGMGTMGSRMAGPGPRQLEGGAVDYSWASDLFEERAWDFGTVRRGGLLTHTFRLTNDLNQIVQIKDVRVSADFLTARANGKQLAPGASANIVVQMDPTRFSGNKTSSIYVQFDQPWQAEVRLLVQADSRDNLPAFTGMAPAQTRDSEAKIDQLERKVDRLMEDLAALRKQLGKPGFKE